MAKISGRVIVSFSTRRIKLARACMWCIGWLDFCGLVSTDFIDRIVARLAQWAIVGSATTRIDWSDKP